MEDQQGQEPQQKQEPLTIHTYPWVTTRAAELLEEHARLQERVAHLEWGLRLIMQSGGHWGAATASKVLGMTEK